MQIKLWGVRGSLPSPLPPLTIKEKIRSIMIDSISMGIRTTADVDAYLQGLDPWQLGGYGGNTSCFEVISGQQSLLIDAGSGMRAYGNDLMSREADQNEFHIFFTHFHWDHLIGLCFFMPIFMKGVKIHFYAVQPELESVIKTIFKKPFFPVPFESLKSEIHFHKLSPREPFKLNNVQLTPYELDHPDPCWGYKIESGGKTFSVCVDTECKRVSENDLGPDLPLYQNVDVMIFDAQYTLEEAAEKVNWGHAAAVIGIDLAAREKIKQMYFLHHDPSLSDMEIASAEKQTQMYYDNYLETQVKQGKAAHKIKWQFAQEGLVIEL